MKYLKGSVARAKYFAALALIFMAGGGIVTTAVCSKAFAETAATQIWDQRIHETADEIVQDQKVKQENYRKKPLSYEDLEKRKLVEVVPNNILPGDKTVGYQLVPYKIRRNIWDNQFTLTASQYSPVNYQTDYLNSNQGSFNDNYGPSSFPFIEGSYMLRYNCALGAIAAELGYGYYSATSKPDSSLGGNTKLVGQQIRFGLRYVMDNLFNEPIIAPYAMGGIYQFLYSETQGTSSLDGLTNMAPYWGVGALLQLNWSDAQASIHSYEDGGIENWYLFAETREYLTSFQASKHDFSSPHSFATGVSIEY